MTSNPEFELADLVPQYKGFAQITVGPRPGGGSWQLPILYATGEARSPILVVTAGVHGNEMEGIQAIPRVYQQLDPHHMRGTIIMVPVSNVPAFETHTRNSPVDGRNLARVFPGSATGTLTERIADVMYRQLIRHADFYIDLHSGGPESDIPTLVGYIHEDTPAGQQSLEGAKAFGTSVIWGHPPPVPPGRTISVAHAAGIPCLYTETPGGGRAGREAITVYAQGILNIMSMLQMRPAPCPVKQPTHHLWGDGNLDYLVAAQSAGLFESETELLADVQAGQRLGCVRDVYGREQSEVVSPRDGVLLLLRHTPTVMLGEGLAFVTGRFAAT